MIFPETTASLPLTNFLLLERKGEIIYVSVVVSYTKSELLTQTLSFVLQIGDYPEKDPFEDEEI